MGQEFSATIPRFSEDRSLAASYLALSTLCIGYLFSEMKLFCLVIPVNPVELASSYLQCELALGSYN